jgi:hypothetical protein
VALYPRPGARLPCRWPPNEPSRATRAIRLERYLMCAGFPLRTVTMDDDDARVLSIRTKISRTIFTNLPYTLPSVSLIPVNLLGVVEYITCLTKHRGPQTSFKQTAGPVRLPWSSLTPCCMCAPVQRPNIPGLWRLCLSFLPLPRRVSGTLRKHIKARGAERWCPYQLVPP